MSNERIESLIEGIVIQKSNIEFEYLHYENNRETKDKLLSDLRNLCENYNAFRSEFPEAHDEFLKKNPKYDLPKYGFFGVLEVFAKDTDQGFKDVLDKITPDTTQTVINIVEYAQTNKCFQWLKRNNNQEIQEKAITPQEKSMFLELGGLSLPNIKKEEFGDIIGMSMAGILSQNYEKIKNKDNDAQKVSLLRGLLAINRKYVTFDYEGKNVTDTTHIHTDNHHVYKPRGRMVQKMVDSSYADDKGVLHVTVCTNDEDIEKQGAQLFKTFKTLNDASNEGQLLINGKNYKPSITFFNQAFFCTQEESEATTMVSRGRAGGSVEKEGFNPISKRADFEKLLSEPMTKMEMDKINGLTTLSIFGNNLDYPNVPHTFNISDIVFCNPVTAGSSTLWMYQKFLQLQVYEDPKKTEKLFNFLLDYSQDVTQSLLKIEPQENSSNLLSSIVKTHEKMISGVITNFTSYNLERPLNDKEKEKINKLLETIEVYNEKNPKFMISHDLVEKLGGTLDGAFTRRGNAAQKKITSYENLLATNSEKQNQARAEKDAYYAAVREEKNTKVTLLMGAVFPNDKEEFNQLKEKLAVVGNYLYGREGKGKKIKLENYLEETLGTSLLMIKKDFLSFGTISNYLSKVEGEPSYINLDKVLGSDLLSQFVVKPGTYSRVYSDKSPANNTFAKKISSVNQEEKEKMLDVKAKVDSFFNLFQSESGLKQIIHQGGLNNCLKTLMNDLEKEHGIGVPKTSKKM
jgi:hypothetical protein